MSSRCLFRPAVVWAAVVAGLAFGTPASASVAYDPGTKIGFIDKSDVRTAFGWTDATLAARAKKMVFNHDFWTDDTYAATCGGSSFAIVHHREFGRFELTGAPARGTGRGAAGYGGKLTGFRLTGAWAGISGTNAPPAAGQPCPRADAPSPTIDKIHLVSTTSGWALVVRFDDDDRELQAGTSPAR